MATQAVLVLVDRGRENGGAVGCVDASNSGLGDPNDRRNIERTDLLRCVPVVAVDASRVAIAVEQRLLSCIMRVLSRRKWVRLLLELGEDIGRSRRDIVASAMASDTILLVGCAKQAHLSACVVHGVTRRARVGGNRGVRSDVGLRRDSILRRFVNAAAPTCEGIHLAGDRAGWIMTGQAKGTARAIANQKV